MTDIINTSIIAVLAVLSALLLGTSILYWLRSKKYMANIVQLFLDNQAIQDQAENLAKLSDNDKAAINNDFIKFLSESRDWAFQYIEDVQKAIGDLDTAMKISDDAKISESYNNLLKFLPDNSKDN
jgi:biopolymer transport protein ExbB/TolQ